MNMAVDVSKSFYSQLQQLKGTENDNVHVNAETQMQPKSQVNADNYYNLPCMCV